MSDNFIKTNQGYVRASAVHSLSQVANMVRLDTTMATLPHYINGTVESVLTQLEGSEPTRPERAPTIRSQEVSKPAQERLGFGSVVDAKPFGNNPTSPLVKND